MSAMLVDVLSWVCMLVGAFFVLAGAIGLLRLPDVFTRLHGASMIDTAGAGFLVLGMMLQAGWSLETLKLLIVLAIFFFTLPVAAHALAQAALHEGVQPQLSHDERGQAGPSAEDESPSDSGRTS
jgi:multicomponent Na+:H+ antiporter subunit G